MSTQMSLASQMTLWPFGRKVSILGSILYKNTPIKSHDFILFEIYNRIIHIHLTCCNLIVTITKNITSLKKISLPVQRG